ncbi:MAG: transcriptional regulator [Elusimicrobia bacterium CG06_land_8_20_14_3_00_38_11]|nr:MAG: transcriptional regulator [Elusimicrobia bacterium CG06_land_8_20_14_3_00_38_11]
MKKIECLCENVKAEDLKKSLYLLPIGGFFMDTINAVAFKRDSENPQVKFVERPRIKIEIFVKDEDVEKTVQILLDVIKKGVFGDGKIFIMPADDVIRVRSGERGPEML